MPAIGFPEILFIIGNGILIGFHSNMQKNATTSIRDTGIFLFKTERTWG